MSHWTMVFLDWGWLNGGTPEEVVADLNEHVRWPDRYGRFELVSVSGAGTPTAVAAFNHMDFEDLVRRIQRMPWEYPDQLQLLVNDEYDWRWREVPLYREEWLYWQRAKRGPANFIPKEPLPRETGPKEWHDAGIWWVREPDPEECEGAGCPSR